MISQKQFYRTTAFLCVFILALTFFTSSLPAKKAKKPQRIHSTDPALRMKWFSQHVEMKKNTPFKDLKWQHIGPKNVRHCSSYTEGKKLHDLCGHSIRRSLENG
jgi:hypothetical protein